MFSQSERSNVLAGRRILIVQQDPLARRALARYFRRLVASVCSAGSEAEADAIFRDEQRSPTDLICGQSFGVGAPLGTTLIARWRERHATLRRVILATGVEGLPAQLPGVDAVVWKPAGATEILAQLLAA